MDNTKNTVTRIKANAKSFGSASKTAFCSGLAVIGLSAVELPVNLVADGSAKLSQKIAKAKERRTREIPQGSPSPEASPA